jgi:4-nitrophenyl phosphatase
MNKPNEKLAQLADKLVYFFDLDGTIYLGNQLFDGVLELINILKKTKKNFYFLSNNSSKSTDDYIRKLNELDLNITRESIILSQHPTVDYLIKHQYREIFLLGTESLKKEFRSEGFILTEENPEAIVLAFDKELTYDRLKTASLLLQEGIPYIATHLDDRCPTENGYIPDAGGIASLLYKATERMPIVLGKPNKEMLLFKLEELGINPNDAVIFGDRLYTDIKMGLDAGVTTCCVLSGEITLELIEKNKDYQPDYVIDGIWDFLEILK